MQTKGFVVLLRFYSHCSPFRNGNTPFRIGNSETRSFPIDWSRSLLPSVSVRRTRTVVLFGKRETLIVERKHGDSKPSKSHEVSTQIRGHPNLLERIHFTEEHWIFWQLICVDISSIQYMCKMPNKRNPSKTQPSMTLLSIELLSAPEMLKARTAICAYFCHLDALS